MHIAILHFPHPSFNAVDVRSKTHPRLLTSLLHHQQEEGLCLPSLLSAFNTFTFLGDPVHSEHAHLFLPSWILLSVDILALIYSKSVVPLYKDH